MQWLAGGPTTATALGMVSLERRSVSLRTCAKSWNDICVGSSEVIFPQIVQCSVCHCRQERGLSTFNSLIVLLTKPVAAGGKERRAEHTIPVFPLGHLSLAADSRLHPKSSIQFGT